MGLWGQRGTTEHTAAWKVTGMSLTMRPKPYTLNSKPSSITRVVKAFGATLPKSLQARARWA